MVLGSMQRVLEVLVLFFVRDFKGHVLGAFSSNIDIPSSVAAEVMAVIVAIELAWVRDWKHIWLEVDSSLVLNYLRSPLLVPWNLRVRWLNCLRCISEMTFRSSHIFREGNKVADALANHGLTEKSFKFRDGRNDLHFQISENGVDIVTEIKSGWGIDQRRKPKKLEVASMSKAETDGSVICLSPHVFSRLLAFGTWFKRWMITEHTCGGLDWISRSKTTISVAVVVVLTQNFRKVVCPFYKSPSSSTVPHFALAH
ncbi:hypothetical protein ACLB2K_037087 [Fragaria x ananassa]